ncbi:MAG: hypothetical protein QXW35_03495 [Candidatus Aenigmatarchaeota archaeon]
MKQVLSYLQKFKANEFLPEQKYRLTIAKDGIWLRGIYPTPFGVIIKDLINIEHSYTVEGYLDELIDFVANNKQLEKKDDIVIDSIDGGIYLIIKDVIDNPNRFYGTKIKLDEVGNIKAELEMNGEDIEAYFVVIPFYNIIEIPSKLHCVLHPQERITITLHYSNDNTETLLYAFGHYTKLKDKKEINFVYMVDNMLLN